jgi:Sulfatase
MPPGVVFLKNRFAAVVADRAYACQIAALAAIHLAALAILIATEKEPAAQAAFVLTWGFLNCAWLTLLRRPLPSAALSLALVIALILLSQFKQSVLLMTANFVDVMLIDLDTFSFLMTIFPGLAWKVGLVAALTAAVLVLLWRLDPFRVRRLSALGGGLFCLAGLTGLSIALPTDREDDFGRNQYVSKFMRSAAVAAIELMTQGVLDADATASGRLDAAAGTCEPAGKLPHIVMVFDESSFDAGMMPNVRLPPNYHDRFRSSDGKTRSFVVEGAGGPSWFTEYNVLSGLSVRSYGRFAESVTRIAAGRVQRGLPYALRRCGYKTYSLYSWFGAFVGARRFQTTTGIENFLDARQLRTGPADTDRFYYDKTAQVIAREHNNSPLFVFVYLATNHFPWDYRYRPDLVADWKDPGNGFEIDEYLRRQEMSVRDYAQFKERLRHEFPDESFYIVRFGDHQPKFAKHYIEPGLDSADIAQRIQHNDPRYFTTYYAFEGLNFRPRDLSSALDTLDAPYLPLVVLEGAGVPLDASFREQKRILQRCHGMFYLCADGAEVRRFNRLLIDAGLLKF